MLPQIIKDVPLEERPRERMLHYGAAALSHAELIAILLRTGTNNQSAIHVATNLLGKCGGLHSLIDMTREEMMSVKGIGEAKAIQLQAGIELGRRLSRSRLGQSIAIRSPKDAAEHVMDELRYLKKEHFLCLFLNTKNHVIARETMSIGTLNAALVHPREVFRAAIKHNSASIICVHNHPSGDPTPSPEDISLTKRLTEAGQLIGIEVLDHVIVGDGRYISLKEHGHL
ncbi:RadC family protein [Paenibacillus sp. IITD108]|uniref:RadC family protein n=2 Tax=unclassified Paenibacillus TaxID=185978 RepID=UPI002F41A87A